MAFDLESRSENFVDLGTRLKLDHAKSWWRNYAFGISCLSKLGFPALALDPGLCWRVSESGDIKRARTRAPGCRDRDDRRHLGGASGRPRIRGGASHSAPEARLQSGLTTLEPECVAREWGAGHRASSPNRLSEEEKNYIEYERFER